MFQPVVCAPTVTTDCHLDAARREHAQEVAGDITQRVVPANPNGFTYDPFGLYFPSFHCDVLLVSLEKYRMITDQPPSEPALLSWILRWFDILARPCHYIRGRIDSRNSRCYYLDITIPVRGEAPALQVAVDENQTCIFHPATGREVFVPQVVPRRRAAVHDLPPCERGRVSRSPDAPRASPESCLERETSMPHDNPSNEARGLSTVSRERLYSRVCEVSRTLCTHLGIRNPHETADDIAHEVCLKLVRLELFDPLAARIERGENLRGFLRACVRNAIRNSIRMAARRPELESEVLGPDSGFDQHFTSTAVRDNDVDGRDSIEALHSECSTPAETRMFVVLDDHVGTGTTIGDACRGLMSPSMFRHVRSQFRKKPKVRRILRDCA